MGELDFMSVTPTQFQKPTMDQQSALDTFALAREYDVPTQSVTDAMRDQYKQDKPFKDTSDAFKQRSMDPVFRAATQGEENIIADFEKMVYGIAGDMKDTGLLGITRRAAAKGVLTVGQMSYGSDMQRFRGWLMEAKKAGDTKRENEVEGYLWNAAQRFARSQVIAKALNELSPVNPISQAYDEGGVSAAAKALWDNLGSVMGDVTVSSLASNAPALALSGAASIAAGGATAVPAALTAGLGSFAISQTSELAQNMEKAGVDTTNPVAVMNFLKSNSFEEAQSGANAYAVPVAAVDALSMGVAGKMIPKRLGASTREAMPSLARAYERYNANVYRYALTNLAAQTVVQSTLGAAGEAAGQIIGRGEIDPVDVALEALGEFGTVGAEVAIATYGARNEAVVTAKRAEARQELTKRSMEQVSESKALSDPDGLAVLADALFQDAPEARTLTVDVSSLASMEDGGESPALTAIREALPSRAQEIDEAVKTGGSIDLDIVEYARVSADKNAQADLYAATSANGEPTAEQANDAVAAIDKVNASRVAGSTVSDDFRASLKAVAKAYKAEVETAMPTEAKAYRNAAVALTMSHVASISKDLGVMPQQVWEDYGIRSVLTDGDVAVEKAPEAEGDIRIMPKTDRAKAAFSEENRLNQDAKGAFVPDFNAIVLGATKDRSTLLHETGHWFMHTRFRIALSLAARDSASLSAAEKNFILQTDRVAKWLGAKDAKDFLSKSIADRRAMEEKFARTYEQYLMEGKAPTKELVSVFRQFMRWLKGIYRALTAVPGSEISPEVREMFDAIFVAYEQTQEAQARRHLYMRLESLGTDTELNEEDVRLAIRVLMRDLDEALVEKFLQRGKVAVGYLNRLRESTTRSLEHEAAELRKRFTKEAIEKAYGERRVAFEKFIAETTVVVEKAGRKKDKALPGFTEESLVLVGAKPNEIAALRSRGLVIQSKESLTLDPFSDPAQFGYQSFSEFVRDVTRDPFGGVKPEAAVAESVEERLAYERPDLATTESIRDSADAAVFSEASAKIVALEVQLLSGSTKPIGIGTYNIIAEALLSRYTVRKLRDQKTIKGMRKDAQKEAERAEKHLSEWAIERQKDEGKREGYVRRTVGTRTDLAADAKRKQLIQMRLADVAQAFLDRAESFVKAAKDRFDGKKKYGSMQLEWLEQLQGILRNAGIIESTIPARRDLAAFYADQQDVFGESGMPEIPDTVLKGKPFADMTVEEAQEFMRFVSDFQAMARERYSMMVDGKKVDAIKLDNETADSINKNAEERGVSQKPQNDNEKRSFAAKVRSNLREFMYAHLRFHTLWQMFEGERFGVFYEAIGKRIDEARDRQQVLKTEKCNAFMEALKPLMPALRDSKMTYYEELGGSFSKAHLVAMAYNIGTSDNFERLLAGSDKYVDYRGHGKPLWTRDAVLSAIGRTFTADELNAIQKVLDVTGSLGPEVVALEERTHNAYLPMVKAEPVTLQSKDGKTVTLKGGYYPIAYDKTKGNSWEGTDSENIDAGAGKAKGQRTTKTGRSMERQGITGNPISLTTLAGYQALNDVINDICWREVLIDTNKIIGFGTRTNEAIRRWYGAEAVRELHKWLRDVATQGREIPVNKWEDAIRKNVGVAGLGFSLQTAALQPIGMTQSVAVVGAKWIARGAIEYAKGPREATRRCFEMSPMMQHRLVTRFKELGEVQKVYGNSALVNARDAVARASFLPTVYAQVFCVDIPTWLGSYAKYEAEGKKKGIAGEALEKYAVERADREVVMAQGSGSLSDLSQMERRKNVFNVFYSFFGTMLNAGVTFWSTQKGMEKLMNLAMIFVVQQTLESMLRTAIDGLKDPDDADELAEEFPMRWLKDEANLLLSQFIYLREVAPAAEALFGESRSYSGPAGVRVFPDSIKFVKQASQGEMDRGLLKATVNITGDLTGLPASQMARIADVVGAELEGEDWNGFNLLFGMPKKN